MDVLIVDDSAELLDLVERALRQDRHCFPILLLTAHGDVPQRVAGLDAGADDLLAKPFAVAELRARIRALADAGRSSDRPP